MLWNRAYCRQPNTYKKQIIKRNNIFNKNKNSASVWIACPIKGCKRPIVTTHKIASELPMVVKHASINYNTIWNENKFRGLKN